MYLRVFVLSVARPVVFFFRHFGMKGNRDVILRKVKSTPFEWGVRGCISRFREIWWKHSVLFIQRIDSWRWNEIKAKKFYLPKCKQIVFVIKVVVFLLLIYFWKCQMFFGLGLPQRLPLRSLKGWKGIIAAGIRVVRHLHLGTDRF